MKTSDTLCINLFYGEEEMNQHQHPGQYPQGQPPYGGGNQGSQPSDGLATAALVCGIISIFFWGYILGVLAIIFATVAKKNGNTSPKATAGLVLGIIGTGMWILICACFGAIMCAYIGF